jgi:hypothetical protein
MERYLRGSPTSAHSDGSIPLPRNPLSTISTSLMVRLAAGLAREMAAPAISRRIAEALHRRVAPQDHRIAKPWWMAHRLMPSISPV